VVYLGEKRSKTGRTYEAWSVVVEKAEKAKDGGGDDDDLQFCHESVRIPWDVGTEEQNTLQSNRSSVIVLEWKP